MASKWLLNLEFRNFAPASSFSLSVIKIMSWGHFGKQNKTKETNKIQNQKLLMTSPLNASARQVQLSSPLDLDALWA